MFNRNQARFASTGIISQLPGEIIDSLWVIIDADLKGTYVLGDLLVFQLENHQGKLTVAFSTDGENVDMRIDLPFQFLDTFPPSVYAYDDGSNQTILLPQEAHQQF
ncbi:DUF960 domain-containing protein [Enterococcus timonensis]|uniref:DUF960 domain-containing protein n=1 Tax=Enterococcus timonensis TaxID=1852364 RepID=UPI0008D94593|nr:DUF960 domain-containing protein [Enterococcus timonensis]